MRAQCDSEKMDQERLLIPLRREVEQLRSQAGQHSAPFSREDAEAREELEALRKKHDAILDGYMVS